MPPSHPRDSPPPPRTMRGNACRNQGITVFWHKNQVFWRKNQGLGGKPGKRETPQKRRRRDDDNVGNKTVAYPKNLRKKKKSRQVNKVLRAMIRLIFSKAYCSTFVHLNLFLIDVILVKGANVCDCLGHILR